MRNRLNTNAFHVNCTWCTTNELTSTGQHVTSSHLQSDQYFIRRPYKYVFAVYLSIVLKPTPNGINEDYISPLRALTTEVNGLTWGGQRVRSGSDLTYRLKYFLLAFGGAVSTAKCSHDAIHGSHRAIWPPEVKVWPQVTQYINITAYERMARYRITYFSKWLRETVSTPAPSMWTALGVKWKNWPLPVTVWLQVTYQVTNIVLDDLPNTYSLFSGRLS